MSVLESIWIARIQLVPVILTIAVFELPAVIRRIRKLYYVPIYFSVFPLRELNFDLSTYLGEDYMYGTGERLTDKEVDALKRKIIVVSLVSMAIGALLTPLFVGFIGAFYLPKDVFLQFLTVLLIYKAVLLTKSITTFHHHSVGSLRNILLLMTVYVCYLGVVFEILRNTYSWTSKYVGNSNWMGLLSDLSTLVFGEFVIGIVLLSLFTSVFVSMITDRRLRENVLGRD